MALFIIDYFLDYDYYFSILMSRTLCMNFVIEFVVFRIKVGCKENSQCYWIIVATPVKDLNFFTSYLKHKNDEKTN